MNDAALRALAALETGAADLTTEQRVALADLRQALMLPEGVHARRDEKLVETRHEFFAGRSDHDASHEIATAWRRYAETAWRRDRTCATCPPHIVDTLRGALWEIMRQSPRVLSASRIRTIVARLK